MQDGAKESLECSVHHPKFSFEMIADRFSSSLSLFAGKSSLSVQFVDSHFVDSYYPTIENTFSKIVRYKGQEFGLDIVDTAGQVRQTPFLFLSPSSINLGTDQTLIRNLCEYRMSSRSFPLVTQ